MAKYRADVEGERYYPDFGLTVQPGDVVELPSGIDAAGLSPVDSKASKAESATPVTDPAPADADAPAQGA